MIQRKQTLFILAMVICNCLLLFIPVADVIHNNLSTHVYLVPFAGTEPVSTMGHFTAIALNFIALLLSFAIIFLYKNRKLQIQLTWLTILIWVTLGLMMWLCPFVVRTEDVQGIIMKYLTACISIPAVISGWLAIRHIQKDIDLLKSADRIR
ncbi:MAG: DUF4293 domain-containing protein [Bacteroidia bacterium]|nr:DUF4293 domain-containing protein [Bacteroidia bacterium]